MWSFSWYSGPVEQAFEAKYPFLKLKVVDLSTELEGRVQEEYKAKRYNVDVIEIPVRRMLRLVESGIIQEYPFPNWPNTWPDQPKHNFFRQHILSWYAPVYNTTQITAAEAPKTWDDLANARWVGKSITTISAADAFIGHTYMNGDLTAAGVNWDKTTALWKKIQDTAKPSIGAGFKAPLDLVVAGDRALMLMATNTITNNLLRRGAPVAYAPFKQVPAAAFSIGLAKNPPNSNAAQLLIDFITSEVGIAVRADTFPTATLHPEAAKRAYDNQFLKAQGIQIAMPPIEFLNEQMMLKGDEVWIKDILKR
ncbi:MAG: futA1 1 [Dehalococcoidia bacterium]|nr:futA1 1 [Dehalococcoidia bacterium]